MAHESSEDAGDVDYATVYCDRCSSRLQDPSIWLREPERQRRPRPTCGAVEHWIAEIFGSDMAHGYEFVERKSKVRGKKKPCSELQVGDLLAVTAGKYIKKRRVINRNADWYEGAIEDSKPGDVFHSCTEPLRDHFRPRLG